jgi:hypothetical protein
MPQEIGISFSMTVYSLRLSSITGRDFIQIILQVCRNGTIRPYSPEGWKPNIHGHIHGRAVRYAVNAGGVE